MKEVYNDNKNDEVMSFFFFFFFFDYSQIQFPRSWIGLPMIMSWAFCQELYSMLSV